MKRWSKLAKRLYELVDESIDFKLHCTVYRMQSRRGSTRICRDILSRLRARLFLTIRRISR